jgi:hypothetical protein
MDHFIITSYLFFLFYPTRGMLFMRQTCKIPHTTDLANQSFPCTDMFRTCEFLKNRYLKVNHRDTYANLKYVRIYYLIILLSDYQLT